jgi:hypothetical protein
MGYEISVSVNAKTKDEAASAIQRIIANLQETGWQDTAYGSAGGGGPSSLVYAGHRRMTLEERVRRLEGR